MRDFPIFTTEYGVSSLTLREIPYKKEAYICIRDVQPGCLKELLAECVGFCRMAGADRILATGHEELQRYPVYATVVQMRAPVSEYEEAAAHLFPVTEQTVGKWRAIYNEKMKTVPNARTLEQRDEKQLLETTGVYFIHEAGELLGIGWLKETELAALAAVKPGAGEQLVRTLMSLVPGEEIILEVALENDRALKLYQRLGFLMTGEIARWYDVT